MSSSAKAKKTKKAEVVDSWEDENIDSDEDLPAAKEKSSLSNEDERLAQSDDDSRTLATNTSVDDVTELLSSHSPFYGSSTSGSRGQSSTLEKRPEKTMSTANRMIGVALGVRIRQTDEQRKAHKALIESEKKRRAEEREKKAEEEKAKRSIWEDN
jgi:hypothetical protein